MKRKNPVELLSPAGSWESIQAAINGGADAIYFGVEQLNMRTRSSDPFTISDIKKIAATCRKADIRAYITLNTVMYEYDMQLLQKILKEVKKHKIDAVIASDFAVLQYCREMGIPVHISTQANISNIGSVQFFSAYADTMVLARELTLKQVQHICTEIKRKKIKGPSGQLVRVEIFVHGALCMAVSGKCYLSLHMQNASANRGACVQTCRRPYLVQDAESGEQLMIDNEYIMSPKDLCTIRILDQVIETGVSILKIEGRSKGADYVQVVTRCYREAADAVQNETFTAEKASAWSRELEKVYNRGFWEGYYLGRPLGEWTPQPGSVATEKKIYIGKGVKYYTRISVGEFMIESGSLKVGDSLMVTGPKCGMVRKKIEELMVNGERGNEAVKGDRITIPFATKVTATDKLYKLVEDGHE